MVVGNWFSRNCIGLVMSASSPGLVKKSYLMNRKERGQLPISSGDAEIEKGGARGSLHFQDFVFFLSPWVFPRERCKKAGRKEGRKGWMEGRE